ncbi:hypothetical protein [Rossellomorea sp. SC111]|uniref:hypothetical protein n=1 Tax=Rossellomorea sp. SC111 TaxID=2968985 RepID=UPI00215A1588|nr:hypothetical protein [Rossellomorea sp. SC111]
MKFNVTLNKGFELSPGTRIKNGLEVKDEILKTELMSWTAGVHSVDEFENTVYYYKRGDFPHLKNQDEMDKKRNSVHFLFSKRSTGICYRPLVYKG